MSEDLMNTIVEGFEVRERYFEDLAEACAATREGCALFDLPWLTHLVVSGAHAQRFVHNMTTCQIKDLKSGEGRFGMSVDSGGKLVADFFVDAEEDRLVIESSGTGVAAMAAHLKSYIIADRVVLSQESRGSVLALTGACVAQREDYCDPGTFLAAHTLRANSGLFARSCARRADAALGRCGGHSSVRRKIYRGHLLRS